MPVNIIGFPDSGKSHWGRIWAKDLNVSLIDSDDVVCRLHGHNTPRIMLKELGIEGFQIAQKEWLSQLSPFIGLLICGGGLPLIPGIEPLLAQRGPIVYLRRSWTYVQTQLDANFSEQPVSLQWYQTRDERYQSIANLTIEWHNQAKDMVAIWKRLLHTIEPFE